MCLIGTLTQLSRSSNWLAGKARTRTFRKWIADDYFNAIAELAKIGTTEVLRAKNPENVRAILGVIAIEKGLRTHGRLLVDYSEDEWLDIAF